MSTWMIYGANGYTGELIAREAVRRGQQPILAGRHPQRIQQLGQELGCDARVFALTDAATIQQQLAGVQAVLLCAGPFSATSQPMLEACLRAKTHYLDITGEISVFEAIFRLAPALKQAGMVAIPGVGFDVVPTDCLAALLKRQLPDATRLRLAFMMRQGHVSRGTMKTAIEGLGEAPKMRKDGIITATRLQMISLPLDDQPIPALPISWGDISTAFYSTGIPTIETYVGTPAMIKQVQQLSRVGRLLRWGPIQAMLKGYAARTVTGPTAAQRAADATLVWGEVRNDAGRQVAMKLRTPEAYALTIDSAVTAVERLFAHDLAPGAYTPSLAFGAEYVLSLNGVEGPLPAMASGIAGAKAPVAQ